MTDAPKPESKLARLQRNRRHLEGQTMGNAFAKIVREHLARHEMPLIEAAYLIQGLVPQLAANILQQLADVVEDPELPLEVLVHIIEHLESEEMEAAIELAARGDALQH